MVPAPFTVVSLREQASALKNPPTMLEKPLDALAKTVPETDPAAKLADLEHAPRGAAP